MDHASSSIIKDLIILQIFANSKEVSDLAIQGENTEISIDPIFVHSSYVEDEPDLDLRLLTKSSNED